MFRIRIGRAVPLLLIVALCLAPLAAAEAGSLRGSKLVASQSVLDWADLLLERLLSAWGQEGVTIDPSGGGGSIDPNGNGSTTPPPIDPGNG